MMYDHERIKEDLKKTEEYIRKITDLVKDKDYKKKLIYLSNQIKGNYIEAIDQAANNIDFSPEDIDKIVNEDYYDDFGFEDADESKADLQDGWLNLAVELYKKLKKSISKELLDYISDYFQIGMDAESIDYSRKGTESDLEKMFRNIKSEKKYLENYKIPDRIGVDKIKEDMIEKNSIMNIILTAAKEDNIEIFQKISKELFKVYSKRIDYDFKEIHKKIRDHPEEFDLKPRLFREKLISVFEKIANNDKNPEIKQFSKFRAILLREINRDYSPQAISQLKVHIEKQDPENKARLLKEIPLKYFDVFKDTAVKTADELIERYTERNVEERDKKLEYLEDAVKLYQKVGDEISAKEVEIFIHIMHPDYYMKPGYTKESRNDYNTSDMEKRVDDNIKIVQNTKTSAIQQSIGSTTTNKKIVIKKAVKKAQKV